MWMTKSLNDLKLVVAWRRLGITWANIDPDLRRYLASLGHNEFTKNDLFSPVFISECFSV